MSTFSLSPINHHGHNHLLVVPVFYPGDVSRHLFRLRTFI